MIVVRVLPVNDTYEYYQSLSQLVHDSYETNSFWSYCADFAGIQYVRKTLHKK